MINWKEYVDNIGRHVIQLLETKQITGEGMPLWDFDNSIKFVLTKYMSSIMGEFSQLSSNSCSQTLYGIRAEGNLHFHSGFVAKIREAFIKSVTYKNQNTDVHVSA